MSSNDGSILKLTRYASGSFQELWSISWPLMLASLSGTVMIFIDRAVLARYQSAAFDVCSAVQPWFWTIEAVLMSFVVCSEILVGRFNGAQLYKKIGPLVWQMVCLSFLTFFLLIPIAWGARYLIADNIETLGTPYLRLLLLTLPFEIAGFGAIGAFFVGRGETKKIPLVLLTGGMINCILDIWFVFGGWGLPAMGIIGAALATNVASLCSFFIFLFLFLKKKYREKYNILAFSWDRDVFYQCVKIGMPNAIGYGIVMSGWSIAYQCLSLNLSADMYKAYCVAFTIYNFMFFVMDGMGKGVGTLCSNFLGAKQNYQLSKVLKQATRLTALFSLGFLLFLCISDPVVQFLASEDFFKNDSFKKQAFLLLWWYGILFGCETLRYCVQAFLIALLKVKIVLIMNVLFFWGLVLLPSYYFIVQLHWNAIIYLQLAVFENSLILLIFFVWYKKYTREKIG